MYRLITCLTMVVLFSGCGGEAADTASPAVTSSAPSASATNTPPEPAPRVPPLARTNSLRGARAFVTYFLELQNYALRTGQTAELRQAIAPECFMCLALPNLIESTYRGGGRIEGGQWLPTSSPVVQAPDPAQVPRGMGFFGLNIHLEPMRTTAADDSQTGDFPGSQHDRWLSVSTRWIDGHWAIDGLMGVSGQQL